MKRLFFLLLVISSILSFLLASSEQSLAHPGNTASDGCHYCWTNCASWGEVYGARHCHGGSSIYTPYSPPIYTPPPSCPLFSYYDSLSDSCKCYSGYIASGGQCISQNQYCTDKYGFNSTYDYLGDGCKCRYGYVWSDSGTKCISKNDACHDQLGIMSMHNILTDTCDCLAGYTIQAGICMPKPLNIPTVVPRIPIYMPTPRPIPTSTPSPTPEPTPAPTPSPRIRIVAPTPTPTITSTPTSSPIPSAEIEENQEVSPVNKNESIPLWRRIIRFIFGV